MSRRPLEGVKSPIPVWLVMILTINLFGMSVSWAGQTQPHGTVVYELTGLSDNWVAPALTRPPVFAGQLRAAEGNLLTVMANPPLQAGQFALPAMKGGSDTYYALISSGSMAGLSLTIVDNGPDTLAVDEAGQDLSGLGFGDQVMVIPYWTLQTLFPNGQGIHGSLRHGVRGTEILLPDEKTPGINLAPRAIFYYFTGETDGGPGWRKIGGGLTVSMDHTVISPDSYLIVRQRAAGSTTWILTGAVPMSIQRTPVNILTADLAQDNAMAFPVPSPATLRESNLYESGAFAGSASHGQTADELLIFDNSSPGFNRAAAAIYYYYTGAANGGPGWRLVGGGLDVLQDDTVVFQPGTGFIIRKASAEEPASFIWSMPPNYLESLGFFGL